MEFSEFVLSHVPPPPARVLEVGCGRAGGVAPALAAAGYDVLAIDPHAPEGPLYRRVTLEQLDDDGPFDAAVAGRVLHHVHPLDDAIEKLARLAPVLVLDEFAWNHVDAATQDWYERQHRILPGAEGPPSLDDWRAEHAGLHTYDALREAVDVRYEERVLEWRPYFYRWLGGPASEQLESTLIAAGAIRPIGWRYVGVRGRTTTNRAPGPSAFS